MRWIIWFGVGFLAWAASEKSQAAEGAFRLRQGFLWIQVESSENGKTATFLLDSGAEQSIIDLQTAREWGLSFRKEVPVLGVGGVCQAFETDTVGLKFAETHFDRPLLAMDLKPISRRTGKRIEGLLGADFFEGRAIQLDYASGAVRILSGEFHPSGPAEVLAIRKNFGAYCVPVSVDGVSLPMVRIDTGCDGALHWSHASSVRAGELAGTKGASIGLSRGTGQTKRRGIALGRWELPPLPTVRHATPIFPGESGLLGNDVLRRFRVTLDLRETRRVLILEDNS